MPLKAIVASLDEVAEPLRGEYSEIPDPADKTKTVFALEVDDSIRSHPKVAAVAAALEVVRKDAKTKNLSLTAANEKLAKFPADFDPDTYAALVEEAAGKGKRIDERIAAVRAEEATKLAKALEPVQARNATLEAAMKRKATHEALTEALQAASIAPEFMTAASALLSTKYKIKTEESEPGEFAVSIDTETGDQTALDFVRAWAVGDEGKVFVAKAKGGGAEGGAPGAAKGGDNPFAKTSFNRTKQQELIVKNPMQARSLAMAAGVRPTW